MTPLFRYPAAAVVATGIATVASRRGHVHGRRLREAVGRAGMKG